MSKFNLSPAINQSLLMAVGTGFNSLLGLAFYLLVIRNLSVGAFGDFSLVIGVAVLAAELSDLGLSSSILKFSNSSEFPKIITLTFCQRLIASVLLLILGFLAQQFFGLPFLFSAAIASLILAFTVVNQAFLAREKYGYSIGINVFGNLARLALFVLFLNPLFAFLFAYVFAFLFGLLLLFGKLNFKFAKFSDVKSSISSTLHFGAWVGGSQAVAALGAKIDLPMIFALSGPVQTGLFGSAQKIASLISQFAAALDSVFAPKLSNNAKGSFNLFFVLALGISLLIIASIPFVKIFVTLVFPPGYQSSIPVLEVLLIGYAIFFLTTPFATSTLYRFGKSKLHLSSSVMQLFLTLGLYLVLLPRFGAMGAALTFVLVSFSGLIFFLTAHLFLRKSL